MSIDVLHYLFPLSMSALKGGKASDIKFSLCFLPNILSISGAFTFVKKHILMLFG